MTAISNPISAHVGRFHRMHAAHYWLWAPPASSSKIEYSTELLREAARCDEGFLYGTRTGDRLRLAAVRREQPRPRDSRLAGCELLGTISSRARGEVFLTESNLEHLERSGAPIALVIAGNRAGFFVYEPDGTIQTIKSHQEFELSKPAPKRKFEAKWLALACAALLVLLLAILKPDPPLGLAVRENSGQLLISWNRAGAPVRLEISDGARRDWIPVDANLGSATYARLTRDVEVRLISEKRSESAHFLGAEPESALSGEIHRLKSEASELQTQIRKQRRLARSLEQRIDRQLK